jgi:hypothetical protein
MLPSNSRVGDTIHFAFPESQTAGARVSGFEVTINGKKVDSPEIVMTRAGRGGTNSANYVFRATEPGFFHFHITPVAGGEKLEPRLNTVEVTQ